MSPALSASSRTDASRSSSESVFFRPRRWMREAGPHASVTGTRNAGERAVNLTRQLLAFPRRQVLAEASESILPAEGEPAVREFAPRRPIPATARTINRRPDALRRFCRVEHPETSPDLRRADGLMTGELRTQMHDRGGGTGPLEEVALREVHAPLAERRQLVPRLDALGNQVDAQLLREILEARDEGARGGASVATARRRPASGWPSCCRDVGPASLP
jgi:hypothetical protein